MKVYIDNLKISLFFIVESIIMLGLISCGSGLGGLVKEISTNQTGNITVLSASASSSTLVAVTYNTDVEQISAEDKLNYSIPGLTVINASRDIGDPSIVNLTTSEQFDVSYTITVNNVQNTSGETMTGPVDKTFLGDVAPTITSTNSTNMNTVVIYFSETVDQTLAEDTANYTISPVLTISSAVRDATYTNKVTLTTSNQTGGEIYEVTISNITDLNNNLIANPNTDSFIGTGATDTIPPKVVSASTIDSNTVEVTFSEPMDQATMETIGYYTIEDSTGSTLVITSASQQIDTSKVQVDISTTFSSHLYKILVSINIKDQNNNFIEDLPVNKPNFLGFGTVPENFSDGPVIIDPFSESSTSFNILTKYKNKIYVGPANSENAFFRINPDGSSPEIVSFIFFGESGSPTTSLNPGPHAESGIDFFAGGTVDGTEYLFVGPSKGSGLDYLYYTTDSGTTLDFTYMDLSPVLGGGTAGVSSMHVFNNDLYAGFPDTGGSKPYFIRIMDIMNDPVNSTNMLDLDGSKMPYIGKSASTYANNAAAILGIDSICSYNNQVYGGNGGGATIDHNGGFIHSLNSTPVTYSDGSNWGTVTPDANAAWYNSPSNDRFSRELASSNKLTPADKAFPAMTVFNNKLYVIRNTDGVSGGPQLWKYDGALWSLVADNGTGLTNMSNANNSSTTLLVVNGDRLYIGYDNSTNGIQLWRTTLGTTDPSLESDFEAVSSDGFGDAASNTVIYSGLSVSDGGSSYIWTLVGKPGQSMSVYRSGN